MQSFEAGSSLDQCLETFFFVRFYYHRDIH